MDWRTVSGATVYIQVQKVLTAAKRVPRIRKLERVARTRLTGVHGSQVSVALGGHGHRRLSAPLFAREPQFLPLRPYVNMWTNTTTSSESMLAVIRTISLVSPKPCPLDIVLRTDFPPDYYRPVTRSGRANPPPATAGRTPMHPHIERPDCQPHQQEDGRNRSRQDRVGSNTERFHHRGSLWKS